MDEAVIARMKEVEAAVMGLDASVRGAAFSMMQGYILAGQTRPVKLRDKAERPVDHDDGGGDEQTGDGVEAFFANREINTPADAVYAIVGYFFSEYGSAPFTMEHVQDLADRVGLTLPDRPDNTLRNATRNNKSLFRLKDGAWITTTTGELVLKEKFEIKKGRKKRPPETGGDVTE